MPVDYEIPEPRPRRSTTCRRAIGRNVATLVPDGATLQLGIGGIPDAVLAALEGRRDLGVHSEMICDGVMRLARAGVINGRRKTLLPGKIVTSFILGFEGALPMGRTTIPMLELRGHRLHERPGDHRRATTR